MMTRVWKASMVHAKAAQDRVSELPRTELASEAVEHLVDASFLAGIRIFGQKGRGNETGGSGFWRHFLMEYLGVSWSYKGS